MQNFDEKNNEQMTSFLEDIHRELKNKDNPETRVQVTVTIKKTIVKRLWLPSERDKLNAEMKAQRNRRRSDFTRCFHEMNGEVIESY